MVKRHTLLAHDSFPDLPAEVVAASDYDALDARLAEAERDAARYRWLRASILTSECASVVMQLGEGDKMCAEKIDAAVDAAMAAETVSEGEK